MFQRAIRISGAALAAVLLGQLAGGKGVEDLPVLSETSSSVDAASHRTPPATSGIVVVEVDVRATPGSTLLAYRAGGRLAARYLVPASGVLRVSFSAPQGRRELITGLRFVLVEPGPAGASDASASAGSSSPRRVHGPVRSQNRSR